MSPLREPVRTAPILTLSDKFASARLSCHQALQDHSVPPAFTGRSGTDAAYKGFSERQKQQKKRPIKKRYIWSE